MTWFEEAAAANIKENFYGNEWRVTAMPEWKKQAKNGTEPPYVQMIWWINKIWNSTELHLFFPAIDFQLQIYNQQHVVIQTKPKTKTILMIRHESFCFQFLSRAKALLSKTQQTALAKIFKDLAKQSICCLHTSISASTNTRNPSICIHCGARALAFAHPRFFGVTETINNVHQFYFIVKDIL